MKTIIINIYLCIIYTYERLKIVSWKIFFLSIYYLSRKSQTRRVIYAIYFQTAILPPQKLPGRFFVKPQRQRKMYGIRFETGNAFENRGIASKTIRHDREPISGGLSASPNVGSWCYGGYTKEMKNASKNYSRNFNCEQQKRTIRMRARVHTVLPRIK